MAHGRRPASLRESRACGKISLQRSIPFFELEEHGFVSRFTMSRMKPRGALCATISGTAFKISAIGIGRDVQVGDRRASSSSRGRRPVPVISA